MERWTTACANLAVSFFEPYGCGSNSRSPSEHPNPTTKIGPKMSGEFTTPSQNGIHHNGFDHSHRHLSLSGAPRSAAVSASICLEGSSMCETLLTCRSQRADGRLAAALGGRKASPCWHQKGYPCWHQKDEPPIWLWWSKPVWDPIFAKSGEFTTHFGTCSSGWIGMFTVRDFDPWLVRTVSSICFFAPWKS